MSNIENSTYIIQKGTPNFQRVGNGIGRIKTNPLIQTLKRLDVGDYIHIPASKENKKEVTNVVKNTIGVVKNQLKRQNPNVQFSYGIAIDDGVYGVSVVRRPDKQSKSGLQF